jgi:uncharacterized membrane protein
MELEGQIFPLTFLWIVAVLDLLILFLAVRNSNWKRLGNREQLHVFLGSCVVLMVMWTLRTEVYSGVNFHLIFMTTLTLMFGWSLAIIAGLLVITGLSIAGVAGWQGLPLNLLSTVILPVSFTQLALLLIRHWLPRHFFIYVYLNAFLTGGLSLMLSSFFSSFILAGATLVSFSVLWDTYLSYFPLMFFPEAVLNGWFMTLLIGYKPHWVSSFRDEEYLHGK